MYLRLIQLTFRNKSSGERNGASPPDVVAAPLPLRETDSASTNEVPTQAHREKDAWPRRMRSFRNRSADIVSPASPPQSGRASFCMPSRESRTIGHRGSSRRVKPEGPIPRDCFDFLPDSSMRPRTAAGTFPATLICISEGRRARRQTRVENVPPRTRPPHSPWPNMIITLAILPIANPRFFGYLRNMYK